MSALQQVQRESAYLEALERAGGDHERLARGLMTACLELAAENEALRRVGAQALAQRAKPKQPRAGKPKARGNAAPLAMKVHAANALELKRRHGDMSYWEAALFELLAADVPPWEYADFNSTVRNL